MAGAGTGPGSGSTGSATGGTRAATTNILAQLRHGQLSGRGLTRGAQVTSAGRPRELGRAGEAGRPRGLRGLWGLGPGVQRLLRGRGEPGWPGEACSGKTAAPRPGSALRSSPGFAPVPSGSVRRLHGLSRLGEPRGAAQAFAQPFSASSVGVAFPAKKGSCAWDCNNAASKFKRISCTKAASWY